MTALSYFMAIYCENILRNKNGVEYYVGRSQRNFIAHEISNCLSQEKKQLKKESFVGRLSEGLLFPF